MHASTEPPRHSRPQSSPWGALLALLLVAAPTGPLLASPSPATARSNYRVATAAAGAVAGSLGKSQELAVPLCPGGSIFYRVTLTNNSESDTGVLAASITDPVPAFASYVAGSASDGASYDAGSDAVVWNGALGPSQSHSITFSVTVDAGTANGANIVNRATATLGPLPLEVEVEVAVDCPPPPLTIDLTKTSNFAGPLCPGSTILYQIRLTNTSQQRLIEARIVDPIPANTTFAGSLAPGAVFDPVANTVSTSIVTLDAPMSMVIGFAVTVNGGVPDGTQIVNEAIGTATDPQLEDSVEKRAVDRVTVQCGGGPEEPARRPLILIPGIMGTKLVATAAFTTESLDGRHSFALDEEVWGSGVYFPDEEKRYLAVKMNPGGKSPAYPTDLPDGARGPAYILSVNPMVQVAVPHVRGGQERTVEVYLPFHSFFEERGYPTYGLDLFAFGWDWRRGAGWKSGGSYVNVDRLDAFINQILELPRYRDQGVNKVDIVAHSQGGFVGWLYISRHGAKVENLITIGTPYLGSPKATASLLWGVNYGKWNWFLGQFGPGPRVVQEMTTHMPGVAELLPNHRFPHYYTNKDPRHPSGLLSNERVLDIITSTRGNDLAVYTGRFFWADFMSILATPGQFGVKTTIIAGSGRLSWARILVGGGGKPAFKALNGDVTVPFLSHNALGIIPASVPRFFTLKQEHLASVHGPSIADPEDEDDEDNTGAALLIALNILKGDPPLFGVVGGRADRPYPVGQLSEEEREEDLEEFLKVGLRCPVHLHLFDDEGRETGQAADGFHKQEIPDSLFEHFGLGGNEAIYAPAEREYELALESYAQGSDTFDLALERLDDEVTTEMSIYTDVPIGPNSRSKLEWGPGEAPLLRLDFDGDGVFEDSRGASITGGVDSDGDGLIDGEEIFYWSTDPSDPDSDGDGLSDGEEVTVRFTDPLMPEPSGLGDVVFLNDGRFRVEVRWETRQGDRGSGQAVSLTDDTGYFWFFDRDNVEIVLKVLDACSFNDRFWVFTAGLTDVGVEIRVTDTETGAERIYSNPQGIAFEPHQDTDAFATCGAIPAPASREAGAQPEDAADTALFLNGGRFTVEAEWRTPDGTQGMGNALPLTDDTGSFWFFGSDNVEVVIKVLDACASFGKFWVFATGLTNVEVTLRVTDTQTGQVREYVNPLDRPFAPIQDTGAFATCGQD